MKIELIFSDLIPLAEHNHYNTYFVFNAYFKMEKAAQKLGQPAI
jgi:hypothetical protein